MIFKSFILFSPAQCPTAAPPSSPAQSCPWWNQTRCLTLPPEPTATSGVLYKETWGTWLACTYLVETPQTVEHRGVIPTSNSITSPVQHLSLTSDQETVIIPSLFRIWRPTDAGCRCVNINLICKKRMRVCGHMVELESQGSWPSGLVEVPQIIVWNVYHPFLSHFFFSLRSMSLFSALHLMIVSGAWCTVVGIAHGSNTAHFVFVID